MAGTPPSVKGSPATTPPTPPPLQKSDTPTSPRHLCGLKRKRPPPIFLPSPDTHKRAAKSPPPDRFEGYEKRLEIEFFSNEFEGNVGLRTLTRSQLDQIVEAAKCQIISQISNTYMDIYLLSESSLIIYPNKFIIKTCGKTQLLRAVPLLISFSESISSIKPKNLRYTRGCFIFPQDQLSPHRSFHDEVSFLNKSVARFLPSSIPEAYVMLGSSGTNNDCWHIYNAAAAPDQENSHDYSYSNPSYTVEMCMTELDSEKASVFHKKNYNSSSDMTSKSGLSDVIPGFEIDDYNFEPCGYSMNAMKGPSFCTTHVTPEDGFSYASFEIVGHDPRQLVSHIPSLVSRVLHCFGPLTVSVAIYVDKEIGARASDIIVEGYLCENTSHEDLQGNTSAIYQTYTKLN